MRLIAWNILAGGGTRVRELPAVLLDRRPDVVVLGEFHANRPGKELAWPLERGGLVHQAQGSQAPSVRGVFVAARAPMQVEAFPEWPAEEAFRLVTARVDGLRVIGTYFPAKAPFTRTREWGRERRSGAPAGRTSCGSPSSTKQLTSCCTGSARSSSKA